MHVNKLITIMLPFHSFSLPQGLHQSLAMFYFQNKLIYQNAWSRCTVYTSVGQCGVTPAPISSIQQSQWSEMMEVVVQQHPANPGFTVVAYSWFKSHICSLNCLSQSPPIPKKPHEIWEIIILTWDSLWPSKWFFTQKREGRFKTSKTTELEVYVARNKCEQMKFAGAGTSALFRGQIPWG